MIPAQRGFTLIEVMLVVVIVGILMGVVVFSLNVQDADRRLLRESERLQADLRFARLLAENDQREIGLEILPDGYRFLDFDRLTQAWRVLDDEPALRPMTDIGLQLRWLDADAEAAAGEAEPVLATTREGPAPDLLFLSSGEATPGRLVLSVPGDGRTPPRILTLTDIGEVHAPEDGHATR